MAIDWKKNLGNVDRLIRVFISLVLLVLVGNNIIMGFAAIVAVVLAVSQFVEAAFSY